VFAPEGYPVIAGTALVSLVLAGTGYMWSSSWSLFLYAASALLFGFTLYFFRDPERIPEKNLDTKHLVLAPADGRIVTIENVREAPFINGNAIQISIFLSIFDVHVNRIPANGVLRQVDYRPGAYHIAWHPKASEKNEHAAFGLEHPSGTRLYFKQIAGLVARRIIYHVEEGDTVHAGERFGVIRFGSRMDVLVPSTVSLEVEEGDRVRAGLSVLGRIPSGSAVKTPALGGERTEVIGK
jgi:phosphatidylserine decarboxylase